jgi:hypothetical protein
LSVDPSGNGSAALQCLYSGGLLVYPTNTPGALLGRKDIPFQEIHYTTISSGSNAKTLTDATPTAFATFAIANGEMFTGEIIYNVKSVDGTHKQALAGRVRFSATCESTVYTVSIADVGPQVLSAAAGTLAGSITIAGAANVVTLSANFDSSQTTPVLTLNYRFDSPDATLAITAL